MSDRPVRYVGLDGGKLKQNEQLAKDNPLPKKPTKRAHGRDITREELDLPHLEDTLDTPTSPGSEKDISYLISVVEELNATVEQLKELVMEALTPSQKTQPEKETQNV